MEGNATSTLRGVVGLGASAGGLAAFTRFLEAMPVRSGLAFIVVQHLNPTQDSMLAELLARHTAMPVLEASDGMALAPDHVFVLPPNAHVCVEGEELRLKPPSARRGVRTAVDTMLRSLSDQFEQRAIGIVLSGTGSDGAAGLRAIRAAGGFAIAQEPTTAEHDGMPRNAINAEAVDLALPVEQMPEALLRYVERNYAMPDPDEDRAVGRDDQALLPVVQILSSRAGYPIHAYKNSLLRRRVYRRMGFRQVEALDAYIELLRKEPTESEHLLRDLLIGVTEFFRDPGAFERLEQDVIAPMVEKAPRDATLRIWTTGCSTGEEVYSLAMLVLDHIDRRRPDITLQMFATDIDEAALRTGRAGIYPGSSLTHLSTERLARYFHVAGDGFQVVQRLRDCVSFAVHNLLRDPPFSRMDLISCRNLLIYIRPELQHEILRLFHFALNPEGYLFLGTSEGTGRYSEGFAALSKQWRIYRRVGTSRLAGERSSAAAKPAGRTIFRDSAIGTTPRMSEERAAERALLEACVPAAVVTDDLHQVRYLHGNLRDFLDFTGSGAKLDLMRMLPAELRPQLRAALFQARQTKAPVSFDAAARGNGQSGGMRLTVHYGKGEPAPAVVTFQRLDEAVAPAPSEAPLPPSLDVNSSLRQLESELQMTRAQLRETVENLETSTEELKSSNEESMAMNEELQAANEELEATTEELRSVNEELVTVNAQLKEKVDALVAANNDIFNLLASTKLATVFLDDEQRLRRYTPAAASLLGLAPADIGRRISHLAGPCIDASVTEDALAVRESLVPREKELHLEDGRTFIRRILPYRTEDDRIAGVVVTFSDVTRMQAITLSLRVRERQQSALKDFSLRALSGESVERLNQEAVALVAATLGCDLGQVLHVDEEGALRMVASVGWLAKGLEEITLPPGRHSHAGFALSADGPVVVEDFAREPRFRPSSALAAEGARSGIAAVLLGEHGPMGVLATHSRTPRVFDTYEVEFVESVANILTSATRLVDDHGRILESEGRYRALAEAFPQLVWTTDGTGRVDFINAFYRQYTGLTAEQATAGQWRDLVHPGDLRAVEAAYHYNLDTGEPLEMEYRLRDSSGQYRWFLGKTIAIQDAAGKVVRRVGAAVDIDAIKRADNALREVDRRKNEFLAMLSHELRNPLSPLLASSSILPQVSDDPEAVRGQAAIIRRQVLQMKRLLDDLLDLARIARGGMTLRRGIVDLNEVLEHAAESVAPMLADRDAHVELRLRKGGALVEADAARITQAIANLLNNAIKYGGPGVEITASIEREGNELYVRVRDTGRGIEPGRLATLFDEFEQGERSIDRSEGGLGLGLALVRRIVELHGGRAWAESAGPGSGSLFTICLTALDDAVRVEARAEKESERPALPPEPRVLVVDDNADAALVHAQFLRLAGYATCTANDGPSALEAARSWHPDAILLDIGLPGIDGYEVARRLRQDFTRDALVLIAVTGYGQEADRAQALEAGFNFHFTKPVDMEFLEQVLRQALRHQNELKSLA